MRIALALALALVPLTGCQGQTSTRTGTETASSATMLDISVWADGHVENPAKTWTLECPSGGTLPGKANACSQLASMKAPFAPIREDAACTSVYGGPQVAEVEGVFKGRDVLARFARQNGCQIKRWNRIRFLFPVRT